LPHCSSRRASRWPAPWPPRKRGAPTTQVAGETLVELAAPGWALPANPIGLLAGDWQLVAGTDVARGPYVSQANEAMRSVAIVVTSGPFFTEPKTDAVHWPDLAGAPELTPAAEAVTLVARAAIYLPAIEADQVDPEKRLRIADPGSGDATAWAVHVHEDTGHGFGGLPSGLRFGRWLGKPGAHHEPGRLGRGGRDRLAAGAL
jgi:hypothetical protein